MRRPAQKPYLALRLVYRLDLTLPTIEENLALDEALLDAAIADELPGEVLRFWESPVPAVIVGRASRVAEEVDEPACAAAGAPILRRTSGGAAVVLGPGCLMYALVLSRRARPELVAVDRAHRYVLRQMVEALRRLVPGVAYRGINDLTLGDRKCSGNSVRIKRQWVLYHGTLLYAAPLEQIDRLLRMPARRPEYRRDRPHREFLTNLPVEACEIREVLATHWQARHGLDVWPKARTRRLLIERYGDPAWHRER